MTQEEKQLLVKDICARLPYGVMIEITSYGGIMEVSCNMRLDAGLLADLLHSEDDFRPYLRPMSSMSEKDEEFIYNGHIEFWIRENYCNAHHFDYRGLIEKGLALEASEGMYESKNN